LAWKSWAVLLLVLSACVSVPFVGMDGQAILKDDQRQPYLQLHMCNINSEGETRPFPYWPFVDHTISGNLTTNPCISQSWEFPCEHLGYNTARPSNQTAVWDIIGSFESNKVTRSFYINGVVTFTAWLRVNSQVATNLKIQWQFILRQADGTQHSLGDAYAQHGYLWDQETPKSVGASIGPFNDLLVEKGSKIVTMILYQGDTGDIDFLFGGDYDSHISIPCDYMDLQSECNLQEEDMTLSGTCQIIDAFRTEDVRNATVTIRGQKGVVTVIEPTLDPVYENCNLSIDTLCINWSWEYEEEYKGSKYTVDIVVMDNSSTGEQYWLTREEVDIPPAVSGMAWWQILIIILLAIGLGIASTSRYRRIKLGGYKIVQVYLVYYDGRLISHVHREEIMEGDQDIVAGMFTAIQNFVEDVFKGKRGTQLDQLEIGDKHILIERGPYIYLAAVVSGHPWDEIRKDMRFTLSKIVSNYENVLASWDGSELEGPLNNILTALLKKEGKGRVKEKDGNTN